MESQPQNPEFRNNPENFHTCGLSLYLIHTLCNRHRITMNLIEEKQRQLIPVGLKRFTLKLIKRVTHPACFSLSPADPEGCSPLNFFSLVDLNFRVRISNWCCILPFRLLKF